tara:strand:- start:67 stop:1221 length:1155 start_codon:yes stop_codon:yes gene_type:complete
MVKLMDVLRFFKFSQKIEVDPAMQRRIAWVKKDVELFIQALLDEDSPMPIIVADVRQCRQAAEDIGDFDSVKYFEEWESKGVYYLSIDGQNRTFAIRQFLSNSLRISLTYEGRLYENILYSELPVEVRQELDRRSMIVYPFTDKSRADLHRTFERINSGVPLNECEKLNARPSNMAGLVRGISADYKSFWTKKVQSLKYSRMHELEYIAQGLMYLCNGFGANSDFEDIRSFYDAHRNVSDFTHEQTLRRILTEMERCGESLKKGRKFTKADYWVLYMALYHLVVTESLAYTLIDPDRFLKTVSEINKELINSSEEAFSRDKRIAAKAGEEEPSKSSYYHWQVSSGHRTGTVRKKWLIEFFREFKSALDHGKLDDCIQQRVKAAA